MDTPTRHQTLWHLLHACCGLVPTPAMTMSDQQRVKDFLAELSGLDPSLTPRDVKAVIGYMRNEVRMDRARWAIRPSAILRQPEVFRDLVLATRRPLRPRGEPPPRDVVTHNGTHHRVAGPDPEPEHVREAGARVFANLRQKLRTP